MEQVNYTIKELLLFFTEYKKKSKINTWLVWGFC